MDTAQVPTSREKRDLLEVLVYDGISEVGANKNTDLCPEMGPVAPDSARGLTVTLDKIGLHALNCFDRTAGGRSRLRNVDHSELIWRIYAYMARFRAGG